MVQAKEVRLIYYLKSKLWNRRTGVDPCIIRAELGPTCPLFSHIVSVRIKILTSKDEPAIATNQVRKSPVNLKRTFLTINNHGVSQQSSDFHILFRAKWIHGLL